MNDTNWKKMQELQPKESGDEDENDVSCVYRPLREMFFYLITDKQYNIAVHL